MAKSLKALALALTPLLPLCPAHTNEPATSIFSPSSEKAYSNDKKAAVLIVDMQQMFVSAINPQELKKELPNQIYAIEYARQNSLPVFVLEYKDVGPTIPELKNKIDRLNKKTYIQKQSDDGFWETNLEKKLKAENTKAILLMGINASACVKATARTAVMKGFTILASRELMADDPRMIKNDESTEWYEKCGIYRNSHKDLLKIISTKTITKHEPKPACNPYEYEQYTLMRYRNH